MNIYSKENGNELNIDKKEIQRYLGYRFGGCVPEDKELDSLIDALTRELKKAVSPRCIYETYRLKTDPEHCILYDEQDPSSAAAGASPTLIFPSKKLAAHLKDCDRALLFAATVGPGADMLIKRHSVRSALKPAILQAIGAAAIEAYADEATDMIRETYPHLKMRFSPGYGDFSLEHQRDFFRVLKLEKSLGISLNDALLMTPTKSITAVIGIKDSVS